MQIPHIEPTHTIDVETVHGWVRLELTEAQAADLVRALVDATELTANELSTLPEAGPQVRPDQSLRIWKK